MDYTIPAVVLRRHNNVFPYFVQGQRVWVKQRRRRAHDVFRPLQKMLYAATRILLLLPPDPLPTDNVEFETSRLARAAELGLRVPAVLHRTDEYFVLEDAGMHLDWHLKEHPAEKDFFIGKAAAELRRMHDLGLAHGGAQIKNITVRDGEIYFIDIEENIPQNRLELFKLRDLFLFLFSLEKTGNDPDLRRISAAYGGDGAEQVLRRITDAVRQLRLLGFFNSRLFSRWSMRDIRAICRLVERVDKERAHVS